VLLANADTSLHGIWPCLLLGVNPSPFEQLIVVRVAYGFLTGVLWPIGSASDYLEKWFEKIEREQQGSGRFLPLRLALEGSFLATVVLWPVSSRAAICYLGTTHAIVPWTVA